MNRIILAFFAILLTARFFSETLRIVPKVTDLIDLAFIPLLCFAAVVLGRAGRGVDKRLHGSMLRWVLAIAVLSVISAMVNIERTHYAPVALFVFGLLEGPALYLTMNALIRNKEKMTQQTVRFLYFMFIVEGAVVAFINLPMFFATGNPDYVSGTFGLNAYQFSALLVIIGGFFLGRMRAGTTNVVVSISIQAAVVLVFLMLQYRTATPAFFAAYLVMIGVMYGRRILRLVSAVGAIGFIGFFAFSYIASSNVDLKFDDLVEIASKPSMIAEFGKAIAYGNTVDMYFEYPTTFVVGAGPGTMVSRSAYTFIVEPTFEADKGVGKLVTGVFGNHDFQTDVFREYVLPLFEMEAVFGSDQANSPASSIVAMMAEIGLPGLVLVALLYITMFRRAIRYLRFASARLDPTILPVASALVAGATYLLLLSPLDNYLEMARVTLPIWLLFWTASTAVQSRRDQEAAFREEQIELMQSAALPSHTGIAGPQPIDVRAN
jgi:hypothetical protein